MGARSTHLDHLLFCVNSKQRDTQKHTVELLHGILELSHRRQLIRNLENDGSKINHLVKYLQIIYIIYDRFHFHEFQIFDNFKALCIEQSMKYN